MLGEALDLIQVLRITISQDQSERQQATKLLEEAATNDFPKYIALLSEILRHGTYIPDAQRAAGLQFKNLLTSKDSAKSRVRKCCWFLLPEDVRNNIKDNLLEALRTEVYRPSTAAQCVSCIASIEFPQNLWPDLIPLLVRTALQTYPHKMQAEASLKAIGYIFEDFGSCLSVDNINRMLNVVVHQARSLEEDGYVRLSATQALLSSLEHLGANFNVDVERDYIIETVCMAAHSRFIKIKVTALHCLTQIVTQYYSHLSLRVIISILSITLEAIKSDDEELALQGIEFWSIISEEEMKTNKENEDGQRQILISKHYTMTLLRDIIPALVGKLAMQRKPSDRNCWNLNAALKNCLTTIKKCCGVAVLPEVLPFVLSNIESEDWRCKDAAMVAYGIVLDILDNDSWVRWILPKLFRLIGDKNVVVRSSAVWVSGRLFETFPKITLRSAFFRLIFMSLVKCLSDGETQVFVSACSSIRKLSEAADKESETPDTNLLSRDYDHLIATLWNRSEKHVEVRGAAFEVLVDLIKHSPTDCYNAVLRIAPAVFENWKYVVNSRMHVKGSDEIQSMLFETLQALLDRVKLEDALVISDAVMRTMMDMDTSALITLEDMLLTASSILKAVCDKFGRYMVHFNPILCRALRQYQQYNICLFATGLVAEIVNAMGKEVLPYCDELITLLYEILYHPEVDSRIKLKVLQVFGEMAQSLGSDFGRYHELVLSMLAPLSQVDYIDINCDVNELRELVLGCYSCILAGTENDTLLPLLELHIPKMIDLIVTVSKELNCPEGTTTAAIALAGDLYLTFGSKAIGPLSQECILGLLSRGANSKDSDTRKNAMWVINVMYGHPEDAILMLRSGPEVIS